MQKELLPRASGGRIRKKEHGEGEAYVIDPDERAALQREIAARMLADRHLLDRLREEIRPLREQTRRIQPRGSTTISLVAADGGSNQLQFDPFLVQLVRVVDSASNSYCLEVITPTTSIAELSARQLDPPHGPTHLGALMQYLDVRRLSDLSPMIQPAARDRPASPAWVQVYRELMEWAVLFHIVREKDFATDTLIIFDGLLRSTVFAHDLFMRYLRGIEEGIDLHWRRGRRQLYLVGVAKSSKVLDRYRLAMALEGVLAAQYPAYVEVPRAIEERAYTRSEYALGLNAVRDVEGGNRRVGGRLFFVKFGAGRRDPIWPVDIYLPQAAQAQLILGSLLNDAIEGFPVPYYPRSLQQAHDHAALVDFDLDLLQDEVFEGIRLALGAQADALDVFRLRDADPALARYR